MTTTHSQSGTLFNDLAALLRTFFSLETLPMNRCANSGMAGEDPTRRDRSLFKCGRCDPYSALDTGMGYRFQFEVQDTRFWTIAAREWRGD